MRTFSLCILLQTAVLATHVQAAEPMTGDDFILLLDGLAAATEPPKNVGIQGIGSGTVAPAGTLFLSASGTSKREGSTGFDGSLSFGAGFGNAKTIGGQASVNITSVSPDDFADSGSLALKFGHDFGARRGATFAALGFDNVTGWGDAADNSLTSSVAASRFGKFGPSQSGGTVPFMATIGLRHQGDPVNDTKPFGGFGIGINQYLGASISYSGRYANAGIGIKLPQMKGASLSVTYNDIFDQASNQRINVSLSFSISNAFGMGS